jgi:hypothetical protein
VIIVGLTGAWLVGVYLGSLLGRFVAAPTLLSFLWGTVSLPLAISLLWRRERRIRVCAVCALFFLLGSIRSVYAVHRPDPSKLAWHNDEGWVRVRGVVCREPDVRDRYVNLILSADWLARDGEQLDVRGRLLVRSGRWPA